MWELRANLLSPGQTITTCMPTQHIATLSGATCCVRLAILLRYVGCYWLTFDHFQTKANDSQHVATHRNWVAKRPQHVAPYNVSIFCDFLFWFQVIIVWPGLEKVLIALSRWHTVFSLSLLLNIISSYLADLFFFNLILMLLTVPFRSGLFSYVFVLIELFKSGR